MLNFSAIRCFLSRKDATDYTKYRGYLNATVDILALEMHAERPPMRELVSVLNPKKMDDEAFDQAVDLFQEHIAPNFYICITVDKRVVFGSSLIHTGILVREVLNEMRKDKNKLYDDHSAIHVSKCLKDEDPLKRKFEVSFDIHHPESLIGIHLMSSDTISAEIMDEVLQSQFIQAKSSSGLPKCFELVYAFEYPYLPYANNDEKYQLKYSRQITVTLKTSMVTSYASVFKSLPGWACKPPSENIRQFYRTGQTEAVRLLGPEIAPDSLQDNNPLRESKTNDLDFILQHLNLFLKIITQWICCILHGLNKILAWQNPFLSLVFASATLLILISVYKIGLILLYIAGGLMWFRTRTEINEYCHTDIFKTLNLPTDNSTTPKSFTMTEKDDEPHCKATAYLIKNLVQSALPPEIKTICKFIKLKLRKYLPLIIFFDGIFTWTANPFETALQAHRALTSQSSPPPPLSKTSIKAPEIKTTYNDLGQRAELVRGSSVTNVSCEVATLGFSTTPHFPENYNHSALTFCARMFFKTSFLVFLCLMGCLVSVVCPIYFKNAITLCCLVWVSVILTRKTLIGQIVVRIIDAISKCWNI